MVQGVPRRGFRLTTKRKLSGWTEDGPPSMPLDEFKRNVRNFVDNSETEYFNPNSLEITPSFQSEECIPETDDEIKKRINVRFSVMEDLVNRVVDQDIRAIIISGPSGLGKSYSVEKILKDWDPKGELYAIHSGSVKATGLYKTLYDYREAGQIVVFDDADSVFGSEQSLNILKKACDTLETREISWLSEYQFTSDDGESVPNTFDYSGSIIFITNLDFDALIKRQHKLTPHLEALMSRAIYIDLGMKTPKDYMARIQDVVMKSSSILGDLDEEQREEIMDFLVENQKCMRDLSLRSVVKLANLCQGGGNWKEIAKVTFLTRR